MHSPFALIDEALAELRASWAAALGCESAESFALAMDGTVAAQVDAMTDAGIIAVNAAIAAARRRLDGIHAPVAAGIASRSTPERGAEGLSRTQGHRSPVKLIAAATGGHSADAARLIKVGQATQGRTTFSGERAPAKRPHLAAGVESGALSVDAAAAIAAFLDTIELRVEFSVIAEAEQTLTAQAAMLSLDELAAVLRRAGAILDPDGVEPKIDELRTSRSLHIREDASGMVTLIAKLDPETAAPIKTAIEAIVTHQLRTSRGMDVPGGGALGSDGSEGRVCSERDGCDQNGANRDGANRDGVNRDGAAVPETRSVPQMQADALAALCRHGLGCAATDLPLAKTTVVVRIPLEAVLSGTGVATVDGLSQPIDAGTARRMAADAAVIPCVLGSDSEILDWGRAKRPFTSAQRLALVERDGGCASCGLPPGMTEAHHLRWWNRDHGDTDLSNGILLCTACHHRIHNDGWEIRIDPPPSGIPSGGTVWFIPPTHVDTARSPRLGGRARFDYSHRFDYAPAA